MPPYRILSIPLFGIAQFVAPAICVLAIMAPHSVVAAPRPPMPGPNLGIGPSGNGLSGIGGQTSPGNGILGGGGGSGGGGLFGGGNGGGNGGGLFGGGNGGGGGPFGGGSQLSGNRGGLLLQSAQFLMLLMSLFQQSNTQASAGQAIMNLNSVDDSNQGTANPSNNPPRPQQGIEPEVPSGQWSNSAGSKPSAKLPSGAGNKPSTTSDSSQPPLGSFFRKGFVSSALDDIPDPAK